MFTSNRRQAPIENNRGALPAILCKKKSRGEEQEEEDDDDKEAFFVIFFFLSLSLSFIE
jgi:hypothetical protein